jgi:hypothetical protein
MNKEIELYKAFLPCVDDIEQARQMVTGLSLDDVTRLLMYLVRVKKAKDGCVRAAEAKRTEELGVTPNWYRIKNDPVKYAKHVEYNRQYNQRKRNERMRQEGVAENPVGEA